MIDAGVVAMYLRNARLYMIMAAGHKARYKATGKNVHRLFLIDNIKCMEEAVAMAEMYLLGPVLR